MKVLIAFIIVGFTICTCGCNKSENDEPLKAAFSFTVNGSTVNFANLTDLGNVTEPYATFAWDFGDGVSSTDRSPSHDYATPGSYNVTLTAKKSGNTSSFADVIIVQ